MTSDTFQFTQLQHTMEKLFASTAGFQLSTSNLCEAEMQERDIPIQVQTHMNFTGPCNASSTWLCHLCPLQTVCPLFGKTNSPLRGSSVGVVAQTQRGWGSETQTAASLLVHTDSPRWSLRVVGKAGYDFWEGSSLFVSKQFRI